MQIRFPTQLPDFSDFMFDQACHLSRKPFTEGTDRFAVHSLDERSKQPSKKTRAEKACQIAEKPLREVAR